MVEECKALDGRQAIMTHHGLFDGNEGPFVHVSPQWKRGITILHREFCQNLSVLCDLWQKVHNVMHESAELSNLLCTVWPGPAKNAVCLFCIHLDTLSRDVVSQKVYLGRK
jgi:hypothetical protein